MRRGYSFRATELEAALGVAQLEEMPQILAARQRNAAALTEILRPYAEWLQLPSYDPNVQGHAFMMYPIVIREGAPFTKEELVEFLERRGIETRDMLPLINQPAYASMKIISKDYLVADWVNTHGFYIGCHQYMTEKDADYVIEQFREYFRSH